MKKSLFIFCFWTGWLLPTSFAADLIPLAKVVRYAAMMIQRYDTNGDGILQQNEWEKMPGTPRAIDIDGDGQITKDELVWFLMDHGKNRTIHRTIAVDLSESNRFDPKNLQFLRPAVPRTSVPPVAVPDAPESSESSDGNVEEMMKANE